MLRESICVICGKTYRKTNNNQKCCSPRCSEKRHKQNKQRRKKVKYNTCKACGKKFIPSEKFKYYCSRECQPKYEKKKVYCEYCGNLIVGRNANAKYCSDLCKGRFEQDVSFKPEYRPVQRVSLIDDINTQAMEKGLSYGAYKAAQYMKEHKYNILEGK